MKHSITAIIPVYNAEPFLHRAIDSVLQQSRPPDEIILVDDGSTDESMRVASAYADHVTIIRQQNAGAGPARNAGVSAAGGRLLAFLDADDYWTLTKLEKQLDLLEADPTVEAVFGRAIQFADDNLSEELRDQIRIPTTPVMGFAPSGMLIRKEAFLRVGDFGNLPVGHWMEWYVRAGKAGVVMRTIPEVVFYRRIHGGNLGIQHRAEKDARLAVLKGQLERRRTERGQ